MGKDLLRNNIFKRTFDRCAATLQPYGVDLFEILTSDDPATFEDITNAFTGIAAIQFGLTDILKSLEIVPDGFAGHSLGEVGMLSVFVSMLFLKVPCLVLYDLLEITYY